MAATITVVCSECSTEIQAPADFSGKKVRCKVCGNVFRAVPAPPAGAVARAPGGKAATARSKAKPAPPVAAIIPETGDDEDDPNPYKVSSDRLGIARCPECANEMESQDAVICLHCGYNTITRERLSMRKIHETTGLDYALWLLPGFFCAATVLFLLTFDILYCTLIQSSRESGWFIDFLAWGGTKMWMCIGSIFIMFFAGRFAYKRLILYPTPPEIDRH